MEKLTSRKNQYISHLRKLAADGAYRRETGEFVLSGVKLLREAADNGAEMRSVLWAEGSDFYVPCGRQYEAALELVEYASPVKESPGPVFSVAIPKRSGPDRVSCAIVLESVQDPGNVGTVLRSADAFGADAVILTGQCADLYSPRTARATMGAIFRQRVFETELPGLPALLEKLGLTLYGAALCEGAEDIRGLDLHGCAVAVGNEGRGLSQEMLDICEKKLIIPISENSESLNAAMAASIIMWEMSR